MSFNFVIENFIIGEKSPDLSPNFIFYRKGFNLGSSGSQPSWKDIILHGNTALTLVNAKADGLNYLKLFGGTEQRNIPEGYTQLDYIESDGTQYIDIDVSGNATFIGTAQSTTDSPTTSQVLVANGGASAGRWFGVQSPAVGEPFSNRWGFGATSTASSTIYGTTKIDFNITFSDVDGQYGTVNDETLTRTTSKPTQGDWIAFAGTENSNYGFIGKTWKLQAVQNDVLVRDFVPCKNSSNIAGMYDLVSGRFFGSSTASNFVAGSTVVPTPDTPMDIVCNNGVLKVRHQSGLPTGYTQLEYIKSNRNIPLGFYTNQNSEIEAKWYKGGAGAQYVYQANSGSALTNNTTAYATDGGGNWRFGDQTISISAPLYIDITSIQNKNGVWFNNERQGTYTNINDFTGDIEFKALGVPTTGYSSLIRLSYIKHRQNGVLLGYYVPCVAPDNSIGLYDLIGGVFYTNADATITAGAPVSDPVDIYTDGTTETVALNLIEEKHENWSINASGVVNTTGNVWGHIAKVESNKTYYYKQTNSNVVIGFFASKPESGSVTYNQSRIVTNVGYFTTPNDSSIKYVLLRAGETSYIYNQSATAEMLLKVGDYQDIQSVLDGAVTRKVGIKVLDGTETWAQTTTNVVEATIMTEQQYGETAICSHLIYSSAGSFSAMADSSFKTGTATYKNKIYCKSSVYATDTTTWKKFLSDQYNAGQPVVVIYSLETPTTESVTAQPLAIQEGTNIVEITQASMDNLELEVSYKAGVEVTVTEIENAQLDNSVEVTING